MGFRKIAFLLKKQKRCVFHYMIQGLYQK